MKSRKFLKILKLIAVILLNAILIAIIVSLIIKKNEEKPLENSPEEEKVLELEKSGVEDMTISDSPKTSTPATPVDCSNSNYTTSWKSSMLINPNFKVSTTWIASRKTELVNLTDLYGINELNHWNGIPLIDPEAAPNLNAMVKAYEAEHPGHTLGTVSCFRSVGTSCGRMCAATGESDHHTGYTCDLADPAYGYALGTDFNANHPEWAWLHENSYKFGFIDRFIPEWAGGPMSEPANVDANGTTGLYETWHFRYVGTGPAYEIATGKYNNGSYDSLEHYLKATGRIKNLLSPNQGCE